MRTLALFYYVHTNGKGTEASPLEDCRQPFSLARGKTIVRTSLVAVDVGASEAFLEQRMSRYFLKIAALIISTWRAYFMLKRRSAH